MQYGDTWIEMNPRLLGKAAQQEACGLFTSEALRCGSTKIDLPRRVNKEHAESGPRLKLNRALGA